MRIILFTDSGGISQFTNSPLFKKDLIVGVVGAFNRPEGHPILIQACKTYDIPFIVQPSFQSDAYFGFAKRFQSLSPTHIISNSYSLIIRESLLDFVNGKAINIHWSLLPKNRGPNPIQWALIKNEIETGVSVHQITPGIDEGPIIIQKKIHINDDDTWVTLMNRLKKLSDAIISTPELEEALVNVNQGTPQNNSHATVNFRLNAKSPKIDFEGMSDREIFNLIRAQIEPLKGAYAIVQDQAIHFKYPLTIEEVMNLRRFYIQKEIANIIELTHIKQ